MDQIEFLEQTCTKAGWELLVKLVEEQNPNRILIGTCLPYVYARKLRELGLQVGLAPSCMDVVDIRTPLFSSIEQDKEELGSQIISTLKMGIAKLKRIDPTAVSTIPINQQALVVGGGIAGMTAALAIADHGFQVDLVEQSEQLGGNLLWLRQTLEGHKTRELLEETCQNVEKHPLIRVHTGTQIVNSYGEVGLFFTTIEDAEGVAQSLEHGVSILATGGTEAATVSYGNGTNEGIVTQMELEMRLNDSTLDPAKLKSVVMIQCVDSREEPRNYCSRVCCASALKHALHLKENSPEIAIYILYRDMMTYGFSETYYTQARKAGVFFIQYGLEGKPDVQPGDGSVHVTVFEPIIGRNIEIDADLVVLASGLVPTLPVDLVETFGSAVDQDGFFQEAETKWRPVDSLKEGVFACGIAHSPRSISESIATAEAAAQRSLRILSQKNLPAGKVVAKVRHSLCTLCERCIDACPYGARALNYELDQVLVNPVMCQGCGSCATVCLNSASILEGFQKQQMFEVIDAAFV
ncbi:MAG: CoB--CoM heterodisulfide reductase iron-sulfur subunit A family protein [Deltaproteobacteria bacterium]|nr:CoB--CoM heterodisulfide reductase iron-sulfur subunit A family protein [Deltaproteobacteria bacterium]